MPRLPSEADLGSAPAPRVGGSVASRPSIDTTASGRATAKLGETVQNVGDAIYQIDKEITKARQGSQLSDAVGRATEEVGLLEANFSRDQDFKTAPKRFADQSELIRQKYEQTIDDPIVRDAFGKRYREISTAKRLNIIKQAAGQEGDYNVASLDRNLTVYANSAANAANMAEREIIINQARIDITGMVRSGWITDVDGGKREREFLGKIDQAVVARDMTLDPAQTSQKLSVDPEYAKNIAPEQRQRLIDDGYRRAETERARRETVAERERKQLGDDMMKEALTRQDAGTLDRAFIERVKPFVSPSEYKSLLAGMDGKDRKDDPATFAMIEGLVETNPAEARREAFRQHRNGHITNQTLQSVNTRTRTLERQEGPKSPYERARSHITNVLKPSEFVTDPAPGARYALAIREFEDYADSGKRTPEELRKQADEVVKRYSIIDMESLARSTGLGAQPTPEATLARIAQDALDLVARRDKREITENEFKRRMNALDKARKAAEKAQANGAGR